MREGSLDAPMRHPIAWQDEEFYDSEAIEVELRRVFDICHGCRRCFNLCDSFPRLFDLIDESETGELDSVASEDFEPVVDACTLCDMCFMTKCPYVPPHEFNLDFPHLMLRAKAAEFKRGERARADRVLAETDRNARLARPVSGAVNWANRTGNKVTRPAIEKLAGIDRNAAIPEVAGESFSDWDQNAPAEINRDAPAFGRKAAIYATCYVEGNEPRLGRAARAVLARNGVETKVAYPGCCAMPKLENGDLEAVAEAAKRVSSTLAPLIEEGYDIVALVPSCALMLKFEWPLMLPDDEAVKQLSEATFDLSEYVVDIAKTEGLAPGLAALDGPVAMHFACHSRAQNMGAKAAEMLRQIPDCNVQVTERCSGHGGKWGMMKAHFETAIKVGRPAVRQLAKANPKHIVSECPLAALHLAQGLERADGESTPNRVDHPIELMARAYGIE